MTPLRLDWTRPVDGVHRIADTEIDASRTEMDDNVYCARTDRVEPYSLTITDLEDSFVIRFINARTEASQINFLSRFGRLTHPLDDSLRLLTPRWFDELRQEFEQWLEASTNTDAATKLYHVREILKEVRGPRLDAEISNETGCPRVLSKYDTLKEILFMEIVSASELGARLTYCSNCYDAYLTGPQTGRKSHSVYCSDKCRVAAMRKRNAAKAEKGE
jgi:hypothetical protein